jgi:peptidoglycan hydrolase-like protein with peptidoglycan-binding domain
MSAIYERLMSGGVKRRTPHAITALAQKNGFDVNAVNAIVDVESRGSGVDADGRVKVLFEKHRFYQNLPASKRAAAVKAGLARKDWISPKKGGYKDQPNNRAALEMLGRAMAIDETAALLSASYGLGQVMGENFRLCGWPSVQAFVLDMCESEDRHVDAMFGFLIGKGLKDEIAALDFDAVARVYNGSGQVETYGGRMKAAYQKFAGKPPVITSKVRNTGLRIGSKGYRVEALQKRLNELGYVVKIDSDFGEGTRRAVLAFQAEHGLDTDGVVGAETQSALDVAETSIPEARQNATIADLRAEGSSTIKAADKQQGLALLTVAGAGVGAADKAGLFDNLSQISDTLQAVSGPLASIVDVVSNNWWVLAVAAGGALFWWSRNIKKTRLAGYQAGRII